MGFGFWVLGAGFWVLLGLGCGLLGCFGFRVQYINVRRHKVHLRTANDSTFMYRRSSIGT